MTLNDLSDAHFLYGKVFHSAFVIDASETMKLNMSATVAFAKRLNLVTRYTGLILFDNLTQFNDVDNVTVEIPVIAPNPHALKRGVRKRDVAAVFFASAGDAARQFDAAPEADSVKSTPVESPAVGVGRVARPRRRLPGGTLRPVRISGRRRRPQPRWRCRSSRRRMMHASSELLRRARNGS
jgi:hypothetical protein